MRDENSLIVERLTSGIGLLPIEMRAREGPSQAWLFRVQPQGISSSSTVVVVNASYPEISEKRCRELLPAIAGCFEAATIAFALKFKEGSASVFAPEVGVEEGAEKLPRVAAAVAIHLCTGAWDESERIEVSVNGHLFSVRPSLIDGTWHALL